MSQTDIPGYTYGTDAVPRSPVSLGELELLQATLLLGEDDRIALRRSSDVLAPRSRPSSMSIWLRRCQPSPAGCLQWPLTANPTRGTGRRAAPVRPLDPRHRPPSSTRLGLTTSTRSAYDTPAGARIAPTASKLPTTFRCATSSPCSCHHGPL